MEYKDIRPAQVLLDPDNPRLPDGTSNDKEAINRLIAEGFEQLVALARDVVDTGEANPAELPIVMRDGDDKYVVLEGNRRFAVLKLLDDPRLADDPTHQAAFARAGNRDGNPPEVIHCAVVASREDADHWITLRHTGANNGVGVRVWSAEQSARHRRRVQKPIDSGTARSITIANELMEAYYLDDHLVAWIAEVRASKVTNIGRFFASDVMTRMQFRIDRDSTRDADVLLARHTADQLHPFFVRAFGLLASESVDHYKNADARGKLLNDHADVLPESADALSEQRRIADFPYSPPDGDGDDHDGGDDTTGGTGQSGGGPAGGDGGRPQPTTGGSGTDGGGSSTGTGGAGGSGGGKRGTQPESRLYAKVKLPSLSLNVRALLKEAQQLRFDANPATTCVLARVVLELAVSDPAVLKWAGTKESDALDHKIKQCILTLDPNVESPRKRALPVLVQAWHEASGIGVAYLHQFLHNPQVKPDQHLARRFSDAFTPLLVLVDDAIS